jgi:hypothetical protein
MPIREFLSLMQETTNSHGSMAAGAGAGADADAGVGVSVSVSVGVDATATLSPEQQGSCLGYRFAAMTGSDSLLFEELRTTLTALTDGLIWSWVRNSRSKHELANILHAKKLARRAPP